MMSPGRYCIVLLLFLTPVVAGAQVTNDLGMMGGSGVAFTPTLAITPESQFRLDITRLNFLLSGAKGMNSYSLTNGLSQNMEFTAKFQSVQAGMPVSPSFIGVSGKLVLPFMFPLDSYAAIWLESVSTPDDNTTVFAPSSVLRGMVVFQPASLRKLDGNLLLGITKTDGNSRLAFGGNASRVFSSLVKLGGEIQYNYYGSNDLQESLLVLFRAHPNVCIQMSPGYLHSSGLNSWMFSIGISASTSNVELSTTENVKEKVPEIPSIDDLEKQIRGDKKNEK